MVSTSSGSGTSLRDEEEAGGALSAISHQSSTISNQQRMATVAVAHTWTWVEWWGEGVGKGSGWGWLTLGEDGVVHGEGRLKEQGRQEDDKEQVRVHVGDCQRVGRGGGCRGVEVRSMGCGMGSAPNDGTVATHDGPSHTNGTQ
eukprot:6671629-Prymnesium_polylepis.1